MKLERQGYCIVGQHWVPRSSLRKMPHDMLLLTGENRLHYSDWDALGWATDNAHGAGYIGAASLGVDGTARLIVNDDNTTSNYNFAQSWVGSSKIWTTLPSDFTGKTNVCFWIEHGMNERDSHQSRLVQMGTCDGSGGNAQEWYSQTLFGNQRPWFSVPLSSVTLLSNDHIYFYLNVTTETAGCWWWAQMAGAADVLRPGPNYKTVGGPVVYGTDSVQRVTMDTCPKCREKLFAYRNLRGRARKETDPVIPPETWES